METIMIDLLIGHILVELAFGVLYVAIIEGPIFVRPVNPETESPDYILPH